MYVILYFTVWNYETRMRNEHLKLAQKIFNENQRCYRFVDIRSTIVIFASITNKKNLKSFNSMPSSKAVLLPSADILPKKILARDYLKSLEQMQEEEEAADL